MRPGLAICLGIGALAGLPAVSEGPGESQAQAEIAGHWVFESWTGEACRFGGTAFLSKTEAPQTYDCELTARQSCQGFIWVVRQSCVAERAGDQLTITSRISNRSGTTLPYPLVHVSLTDRYEEVIGSRMLEPEDYLPPAADPAEPVPAGDDFTATISIASTSPDATGFKLNVCYREADQRLRCAIEDFKEP